ncbi:hypothetical protein HBI48_189150 [Parastagonospora nodorum]|nr:hypothetical protein HBI48_189150 [Parastagonospora nodorum]
MPSSTSETKGNVVDGTPSDLQQEANAETREAKPVNDEVGNSRTAATQSENTVGKDDSGTSANDVKSDRLATSEIGNKESAAASNGPPPDTTHGTSSPKPSALAPGKRGPGESFADFLKRTWTCEVERASMQVWRKRNWLSTTYPRPIIEAFYVRMPQTTAELPKDGDCHSEATKRHSMMPKGLGNLRSLQRILIHSEYLFQEFLDLTGVPLAVEPIIIAPPYKILVRFVEDAEKRLVQLREKLAVMDAEELNDDKKPQEAPPEQPSKMSDNANNCEIAVSLGIYAPEKSGEVKEHNSDSEAESEVDDNTTELTQGPLGVNDLATDAKDLASTQYQHLTILHDFVKEELGDVLSTRSKITDGTLQQIHFEDLWHLFEPGDMVYSTAENGSPRLYKVYFTSGGQSLKRARTSVEVTEIDHIRDKVRYWQPAVGQGVSEEEAVDKMLREEGSGIGTWTPFKVDCYSMLSDGERCGPIEKCQKIWPYEGSKEVTALAMYPLRFHPKKDELLRDMVERGRRYLFNGGHKSYEGKTIALTREDSELEIQSDVYVDSYAYNQDNPLTKPILGRLLRSKQNPAEVEETSRNTIWVQSGNEIDAKFSDDFMTLNRLSLEPFVPNEANVSSEMLALMPHCIEGYAFQLRKWFTLDLNLIEDIDHESAEARAAGFDDLVIPKRYRNLLVALVDSHASGFQRKELKSKQLPKTAVPTQIDIVRGKGQGLIILLHGPPGSGKTSTAETIAAYTRRPLYSITCGDIGTDPEIVEKNLLEHTRRADQWGCVLLLDEADVFLVQRDWANLQRNALTSIFLRQLEYYAGILFLTTNRPGVIDEAFKSRVHISLRYPSVDLDSTKKQWTNILNRIEADNKTADVKVIFDKELLLEFAQRHFEQCERMGVTWNGRQIRNAFQTALALGHYERIGKIREAGMTPEEAMKTGKKKWRSIKLTKANFANIAKTAKEFEQYIEMLRGNDSQNARESELRYDEYDPERPRARKQYPAAGTAKVGVKGPRPDVWGANPSGGKGRAKKSAKFEEPLEEEDGEEQEGEEEDEDDDDDDEDEDQDK